MAIITDISEATLSIVIAALENDVATVPVREGVIAELRASDESTLEVTSKRPTDGEDMHTLFVSKLKAHEPSQKLIALLMDAVIDQDIASISDLIDDVAGALCDALNQVQLQRL